MVSYGKVSLELDILVQFQKEEAKQFGMKSMQRISIVQGFI